MHDQNLNPACKTKLGQVVFYTLIHILFEKFFQPCIYVPWKNVNFGTKETNQ